MATAKLADRKVLELLPRSFSPAKRLAEFIRCHPNEGAVATFNGFVRGGIKSLTIEAYPKLAQNQLNQIATEALAKFAIGRVLIIHRYGVLKPTDAIVTVAVTARHRQPAFAGCGFITEALKTRIALWKCELTHSNKLKWITPPPSG